MPLNAKLDFNDKMKDKQRLIIRRKQNHRGRKRKPQNVKLGRTPRILPHAKKHVKMHQKSNEKPGITFVSHTLLLLFHVLHGVKLK